MVRAASLLVALGLIGSAAAQRIPEGRTEARSGDAFVRVTGTQLTVAGRPFVFVGANFNPIHGERDRAAYQGTLRALVADGMTVGRVWVLGEGPADASEWLRKNDLFRAGPTGYIEETYVQLDRVLQEAGRQGVRLILTLSNHWKDYGGIPMYLTWAGVKDEGLAFESFYSDERMRAFYRDGVARLLSRTNTLTGVRYVDDPTILSWELMNESVVLTQKGAAARRAWVQEMAGFIKVRDPNHLVTPGLLGYEMRAERAEWVRVCQLPEIDYCDSHLYPQTTEQARTWAHLRDFLDDRAQLARFVIKKPLVFGEFGFRTDGPRTWLGVDRAVWFGRFVDHVLYDGAAGVLAWIYEPHSGKARDYGIYTDRSDTDDVRAALRRRALAVNAAPPALRNPRLTAARGDGLLYRPDVHLVGWTTPHGIWRSGVDRSTLEIPPEGFATAIFERAGSWRGGAFVHAYGANTGRFTYRFTPPSQPPRAVGAVVIEARVSSEWPGTSAPADGGSPVRVLLDGAEVAQWQVIPDNGVGRVERAVIAAPAAIARLRTGVHTLSFVVPNEPQAHGLCIYGVPAGEQPVPVGDWGPIRIRYVRSPPL